MFVVVCAIGRLQTRLVGGGNVRRKRLDRLVEGRTLDALRDQHVQLADDVVDNELGLDDAGFQTFAEAADGTLVQQVEAVDALQAVLIILDGLVGGGTLARR